MKFDSLKDIEKNAIKPGSFKHTLMQLEAAGVGKITKQNTTVDVKPGETKRQAAKFGNKVDKGGVPPTLSKKVKGSKTNVAFNLGMVKESKDLAQTSEIYVDMDGVLADFFGEWQKLIGKGWRDVKGKSIEPALQAIRDKDDFWLSLPMTQNAKGLLNLIKDVKGSYNILSAPLAGDKKAEPHKREWIKKNLSFFPPKNVIITANKQAYAKQSDGTPNILIDDFGSNISKWEGAGGVGFKHKDHKFERTAKNIKKYMQQPAKEPVEEGDLIPNPQRSTLVKSNDIYQWYKMGTHMANIKAMPANVIKRDKPDVFIQFYGGDKEKKYMMKQLKRLGYDIQDADGYKDTHFDEDLNDTFVVGVNNFFENFADGKKKGKSRPGRVKKSGASCNGSVTSLRKRAKASSGEKAKMYHWCANMKSGRKK
jgi:5'(3')-deoxyribonucleotidase